MKTVITYGTYDLLHQGHINLLKRAKALGDYLIVGVTSDNFDKERGKLNVKNNVLERVEAVKQTGLADKIIIEDYIGQKIDDIQHYEVDIFAIGSDWEGKFDYLNEFCQVIYLPRTEGISSTLLRNQQQITVRIGIIGSGRIAKRFVPESKYVSGVKIQSVFNPDIQQAKEFSSLFELQEFHNHFDDFIQSVDAVYIASTHLTHYEYIKKSLEAGKHVLCEIPLVLSKSEAQELYLLAEQKKLILLEASKTAFFPAFKHLTTLVKSGIIGNIVDIRSSLSKLLPRTTREFDIHQAGGCMTELSHFPLLSIIKLLGKDIKDFTFVSKIENGVDIFTKGIFYYKNAIATITLGLGVKTEGNLVISGTKGYIYVPSPWWLTDYFEIRFEDQNKNKKYFYSREGEGLRYELQEFISMIITKRFTSYYLRKDESILIADIIEKYRLNQNLKIIQ